MAGELTPEQVAHEQAMVDKVDNLHNSLTATPAEPAPVTAPARPENIPEQFWDAEKGQVNQDALLKAYQEATAGKQEPVTEQTPEVPPEQKAAEEAAKAANLDIKSLQAEFDKSGTLSPESYAALEKVGFSKDIVDQHIAGVAATVQLALNEAHTLAGGKDAYTQMGQWAASNLSADEQAAYDSAVGGTPAQRKQAILALKSQYESAVGKDPSLVSGQSGGSSSVTPFASRAEVTAAMRDSRYTSDPAYRAQVMQRLDAMDSF